MKTEIPTIERAIEPLSASASRLASGRLEAARIATQAEECETDGDGNIVVRKFRPLSVSLRRS